MASFDYSQSISPQHASMIYSYRKAFSAPESNAVYSVHASLRELYPDHHVTRVAARECDLLGFAEAGHASAQLLDPVDVERTYVPELARSDRHDPNDSDDSDDEEAAYRGADPDATGDRLVDSVSFASYSYQWDGKFFLVYSFVFERPFMGRERKAFLLTPRSAGMSADGLHSPAADALVQAASRWQTAVKHEIFVFDDGYWDKSKELWSSVRTASWADVVLDPRTKDALIRDVQGFFAGRELYRDFQVPWKRGIILHGAPGNGKTLSIKALMQSLYTRTTPTTSAGAAAPANPRPIPSLYVKSLHNCAGPQAAVRSIFRHARRSAPCLLIFEDLDSLITDKVRSYFLNEVDGLAANDGILMVGSTNHLAALDPAIAHRPSRFDRKYHFALPRRPERLAYARLWQAKLRHNPRVVWGPAMADLIADWTAGFSFAYLKELFVSALLVVARGSVDGDGEADADAPEREPHETEEGFLTPGSGASAHHGDEAPPSAADEGAKEADAPSTLAIPEMAIPPELEGNALLLALKQQVVVLLREMDSSRLAEEKAKKKKKEKDEEDEDDD